MTGRGYRAFCSGADPIETAAAAAGKPYKTYGPCGMPSAWDAGGEVLGEPMEIPSVGQYVSFTDAEGNRVGMLQPTGM